MPITAPYGSWKSPITSDLIVARAKSPGSPMPDGNTLYWLEGRPEEKGRIVIVRRLPDGRVEDVLPQPYNARTRVHEYGGGSCLVKDGTLYFSNFTDQRLYRLVPGQNPHPLTPPVDLRYADYVLDAPRGRLIAVREDHTTGAPQAVNTICDVRIDDGDLVSGGRVLVSGNDFYSTPRLNPAGTRLCWLTWNHPNMPWDGTELWVASIDENGMPANPILVAGGETESIFQPEWSPDGVLYFISDRTGWWNLYRWQNGAVEALHPAQAEFGEPQWVFGMSTYAFESASRLVCVFGVGAQQSLAVLDTRTLDFRVLDVPYTEFSSLRAGPGFVVFNAGSPTQARAVIRLSLDTLEAEVIRRSTDLAIDPGYISIAQRIEFPTEGGLTAYAYYYPPTNQDFTAPAGELPPLIVKSHGGPTGGTSTVFGLNIQYWTSRGFAVVDVDYGGSAGYGRDYRERLKGQWGIVDVDDCVNAARYLASSGKADPRRMAITGGSAGGYTTLCALTFRDVFQAGASHYGVSDAEALATDTHKFESRYLDGLMGPYPQARDVYVARSPIHFTHQLNCALILFQGADDRVVPPDQSRKMFEAARARELPTAYIEFEGEQHGFRQSQNIKRALDGELYFYSKVFKFNLADQVEPVQIENLD
jgi:dipeptidyl aminopeptidase/acylaminoacyl peptidase